MSKQRFIVAILIAIYAIFVFPLELLDFIDVTIFLLIGLILFALYFYFRKREKQKLIYISKIYLHECDPIRYIEEYNKYLKNFVLSKRFKTLHKITNSMAYLAAGKIDEAKQILDEFVENEPNFYPVIRFWYYKAWIYYFEETKELARIKILIQEVQKIIHITPLKYRPQLLSNYNQMIARYYVASKIHLNLAEDEFKKVFNRNLPKLNVVVNVYYLGVISFLNKDYVTAKEYFNSVIKNGNRLIVVDRAKEYLDLIDNGLKEDTEVNIFDEINE